MDDVRIIRPVIRPALLRDKRLTAGLVAQYIHELSDRHATTRRDVQLSRTQVREPGRA